MIENIWLLGCQQVVAILRMFIGMNIKITVALATNSQTGRNSLEVSYRTDLLQLKHGAK